MVGHRFWDILGHIGYIWQDMGTCQDIIVNRCLAGTWWDFRGILGHRVYSGSWGTFWDIMGHGWT